MRNPNLTVKTFEPGLYYVGDLSYIVEDWDDIVNQMYPGDGVVNTGTMADKNGKQFAVFSTMYGDGIYYDGEEYEYAVDSGTIGVYPIDKVEDADDCYGQVWEFEEQFTCNYDEETGVISVADIRINTKD